MADLDKNTDGTPISGPPNLLPQQQSEYPQQMQNEDEVDLKANDSGEEYSSGSDRSLELDDAEDGRGDSGSGGGANEDCQSRRRRRRRRHGSHGSRRHKGGSRHKHRPSFQPYPGKDDLGDTLKRKSLELQEKENAAAVLRRDEGQEQLVTFPVAPFNSTQYLMDEQSAGSSNKGQNKSDNLKLLSRDAPAIFSTPSTPKDDSIDSGEVMNFFRKDNKEFADIYSSVHAENLQSMSKDELVKHYMSLEDQVAKLRKKVAEVQQKRLCDADGKMKLDIDLDKDSVTGSDTNSLSSANEEFVDLTFVNQANVISGVKSSENIN